MKYKMSKGMKIMLTALISIYLGNLVLDILSANSNINIWIARIIGLLLDFYCPYYFYSFKFFLDKKFKKLE
ncbi:hypothetical protein MK801_11850 (plasmid) [Lactococcus lactis]|uniref:hypothetical protein n=1 Tax=Lactococcus lactis TaxID=1358 RepID=UPI0020B8AD0F|nr:hypothetical protein MK801_11850 [Lactococcus lactis]